MLFFLNGSFVYVVNYIIFITHDRCGKLVMKCPVEWTLSFTYTIANIVLLECLANHAAIRKHYESEFPTFLNSLQSAVFVPAFKSCYRCGIKCANSQFRVYDLCTYYDVNLKFGVCITGFMPALLMPFYAIACVRGAQK